MDLRDFHGEATAESLAREGETMTGVAMVTYAYNQIEQARTEVDLDAAHRRAHPATGRRRAQAKPSCSTNVRPVIPKANARRCKPSRCAENAQPWQPAARGWIHCRYASARPVRSAGR